MTKEELEKENERLRKLVEVLTEQNKELEKRYNLKCFEFELFLSQMGIGHRDLTQFANKD